MLMKWVLVRVVAIIQHPLGVGCSAGKQSLLTLTITLKGSSISLHPDEEITVWEADLSILTKLVSSGAMV